MSHYQPRDWTLDDERNNIRYTFRPIYEIMETEDVDFPEMETSDCSLVDIAVTAAEEFDERGFSLKIWQEPESHRFNDRCWKLLQQQPALLETLQQRPSFPPAPLDLKAQSAAETLARMRELRKQAAQEIHEQDQRHTG